MISRITFKFFQAEKNLEKFYFVSWLERLENEKDMTITDETKVFKTSVTTSESFSFYLLTFASAEALGEIKLPFVSTNRPYS